MLRKMETSCLSCPPTSRMRIAAEILPDGSRDSSDGLELELGARNLNSRGSIPNSEF